MSVGVKITERVSVPTAGTAPAAGVYTNVPGTDAVAFNWVALSAVPTEIAAGVGHVITGVRLVIVSVRAFDVLGRYCGAPVGTYCAVMPWLPAASDVA